MVWKRKIAWVGLFVGASLWAADGATSTRMIVTVEPHHHAGEVPAITPDDVRVTMDKQPVPVQAWTPARALQLYILIDDAAESDLGLQFKDIKEFINRQPATTQVAIGYMRNGTVLTTQEFTSDHEQAGKGLRLPIGTPGANGSAYFSLVDLLKKWPASDARREVLMVTNGVEGYSGGRFDSNNPYVLSAIEHAQRAGVVVYSIYYAGMGHAGHSLYQMNASQSYLSQVSEETGGEAYFQGMSSPVSLTPFLKEFEQELQHQFFLTIAVGPAKHKHELEPVKLNTEVPHVELRGPGRVPVAQDGK